MGLHQPSEGTRPAQVLLSKEAVLSLLVEGPTSKPSALLSNWPMMADFLESSAEGCCSSASPAPIRHSAWAGPRSSSPCWLPPAPPPPLSLCGSEGSTLQLWPVSSPSTPPAGLERGLRSAEHLEDCSDKGEETVDEIMRGLDSDCFAGEPIAITGVGL